MIIVVPSPPTPPPHRHGGPAAAVAGTRGERAAAAAAGSQIWGSRGFPHGIPAPGPNTRGRKSSRRRRRFLSRGRRDSRAPGGKARASPSHALPVRKAAAARRARRRRRFPGLARETALVPEGWPDGFMVPWYERPQSGSRSQGHPARAVEPQDGSAPAAYTRVPPPPAHRPRDLRVNNNNNTLRPPLTPFGVENYLDDFFRHLSRRKRQCRL